MIHFKNYFNLVQDLLNKPELIEQLEPENQLLLKQVADSIYHEVAVDSRAWIGVDLDGTLAHYNGWKGDDEIGEPVTLMKKRVLSWVEHGQRVGDAPVAGAAAGGVRGDHPVIVELARRRRRVGPGHRGGLGNRGSRHQRRVGR